MMMMSAQGDCRDGTKSVSGTEPTTPLGGDTPVAPTAQPAIPLEAMDLERLGRERPPVFSSATAEFLFCFALLASAMMSEYFVSGFNIILPDVADALHIDESARTWPTSVFSLVTGSFLLPFGRLADMYGGYVVFVGGLAWLLVWSLVSGFSSAGGPSMLIATRALAGLGPAAFGPASIMLLGKTYRPGPRKNLVFSLYGAFAPIGFFIGIILGGVTADALDWRWYFFIGCATLGPVVLAAVFVVPNDWAETREQNRRRAAEGKGDAARMDWLGVATTVPGLILVVFAITEGAHAPNGWRTPYIIVTFVLGVLFLAAAVYVEGWVAAQPLLPFDMFQPRYMIRLVVALSFCYGSFGIFLLYANFYIQEILKKSALLTAVWFAPMATGGMILATVGGFTMHVLPGRVLLIIAGLGGLLQMLLFALVPDDFNHGGAGTSSRNFWAFIFPAMVGATVSVDITYNVSNVFITTQVPRRRQGVAGAVIFSLLFLSIGLYLGLADLIVAETRARGKDAAGSYKVVFWFGTAVSAAALVLFSFIKIGMAKSELLVEEREALQQEQEPRGGQGGQAEK